MPQSIDTMTALILLNNERQPMTNHSTKTSKPAIAVIDGMGGGIGAQIVTQLRHELPLETEILALGANAIATQKMMQARASRGASGENAIRVSVGEADFILAPIGVVIPNSMMGEITPQIAIAIAGAPARKLLLPINQPHFELVGIEWQALTKQISAAIALIQQDLEPRQKAPPH